MDNLLDNADIVCSTLNSAGSEKISYLKERIEFLIVDEAA